MQSRSEQIVLQGSPIEHGIAKGELVLFSLDSPVAHDPSTIQPSKVTCEIDRYRHAVDLSRKELYELHTLLLKDGAQEQQEHQTLSVIRSHIQLLDDPMVTTFIERQISKLRENSESVMAAMVQEYAHQFSRIEDPVFKSRFLDVKDLSQRILGNLNPLKISRPKNIPRGSIVVIKELIPSMVAEIVLRGVNGFITQVGGEDSHAALILKARGIPCVTNIDIDQLLQHQNRQVILDGHRGQVIIHPCASTLAHYRDNPNPSALAPLYHSPPLLSKIPKRQSAYVVQVMANLDSVEQLTHLGDYHADGVGLLRSEFLFFNRELSSFSEEDQYQLYRKIAHQIGEKMPLFFRVFDFGGDKQVQLSDSHPRSQLPNLTLGARGIRFLLSNPLFFKTHLRALIRATRWIDLRIILPMISDVTELQESQMLLQAVIEELDMSGCAIRKSIPLGCMIEVPSAVIMCPLLAQRCDFFSIGTNDLIQYTLASDRTTRGCNPLYRPTHPSIIRMIDQVVEAAQQYNRPVSLCGEIADPKIIPLFLLLGLRTISCQLRYIPRIRWVLDQLPYFKREDLQERLFACSTIDEVESFLKEVWS